MTDNIRARNVNDIGAELSKIAANPFGKPDRQAVFGATGYRERGNADEIAGRRKRRIVHGRRIDAHLDALPEQVTHKSVECLVRSVADIIVIARKERHAEVGRLHRRSL